MKRLISLTFLLFLASCSTFPHSTKNATVFDTDATVRLASYVDISPDGYDPKTRSIRPNTIICPEPSPDVAKAIQLALSAAANMGNGNNTNFQATYAESLMQLGKRIATVQLLRDELSDLCRNYANGAISGATYTIRLSRLDKKMVTLLSSEAAAGALSDSAHALTGASSLSKKGNFTDIDTAQKAVQAAGDELKTTVEKAQKSPAEATLGDVSKTAATLNTANQQLAQAIANNSPSLRAEGQAWMPVASGVNMTVNTETIEDIQDNFIRADDSSTIIDACLTNMAENDFDENDLSKEQVLSKFPDECAKAKQAFSKQFDEVQKESPNFSTSSTFDQMLATEHTTTRNEMTRCVQKVRLALWHHYGKASSMSRYCQQVALPRMFGLMEKQAEHKANIKLNKQQNSKSSPSSDNAQEPTPQSLEKMTLTSANGKLTITPPSPKVISYVVRAQNKNQVDEMHSGPATANKPFAFDCTLGDTYEVSLYRQNKTGKGKKPLATKAIECAK